MSDRLKERRSPPASLGKFSSREVWLLHYCRELEDRLERAEVILRRDNEALASQLAYVAETMGHDAAA